MRNTGGFAELYDPLHPLLQLLSAGPLSSQLISPGATGAYSEICTYLWTYDMSTHLLFASGALEDDVRSFWIICTQSMHNYYIYTGLLS